MHARARACVCVWTPSKTIHTYVLEVGQSNGRMTKKRKSRILRKAIKPFSLGLWPLAISDLNRLHGLLHYHFVATRLSKHLVPAQYREDAGQHWPGIVPAIRISIYYIAKFVL